MASHDLSEPLRAITAFAERLAERYRGQLDDDAEEYLRYIVEGADRLRTLIQALLAYSRLGRTELRLEPIDTGRMVRHLLTTLPETGVVRVSDRMPRIVADRTQLGQVFQNLIGNAQKFVDRGEPEIVVSAERTDGGWRFDVADNGIGVDPRYADRIFEPFERLHTRERFPGAGIGLSICRQAVERHGGTISVAPRAQGGTVFSFTIPDL